MKDTKEKISKLKILKDYLQPFKKSVYLPLENRYHERRKRKELDLIKKDLGIIDLPPMKILVYPNRLRWANQMWAMLYLLNIKITYDPNDTFDIALHWHDTTFKALDSKLLQISDSKPVINLYCTNISKTYLDQVCEQIFGYSTIIDPLTFEGKSVKKSNLNFQKNGEIIDCPILAQEVDCICQLLIDTEVDDTYFMEYRVPVFGNHIPFVFEKLILIEERFWGMSRRVTLKQPQELFSQEEISNIIQVCQIMNIDYCELDVLRDKYSQKLYIVDINDTPGGLQGQKNPDEGRSIYDKGKREEAILSLARAFHHIFLENRLNLGSQEALSKRFNRLAVRL